MGCQTLLHTPSGNLSHCPAMTLWYLSVCVLPQGRSCCSRWYYAQQPVEGEGGCTGVSRAVAGAVTGGWKAVAVAMPAVAERPERKGGNGGDGTDSHP